MGRLASGPCASTMRLSSAKCTANAELSSDMRLSSATNERIAGGSMAARRRSSITRALSSVPRGLIWRHTPRRSQASDAARRRGKQAEQYTARSARTANGTTADSPHELQATVVRVWRRSRNPGATRRIPSSSCRALARLTAPGAAAGRVDVTAGGKSLALILGKAEWSRAITTDQNGISRSQD